MFLFFPSYLKLAFTWPDESWSLQLRTAESRKDDFSGGRTTSLGILIAIHEGRRATRGNHPSGSWDAQQTPSLCQESYWPKMKGDSPLSTSLWSVSLFCKVVSNRFRTPGGRLQLEKFSKKFLLLSTQNDSKSCTKTHISYIFSDSNCPLFSPG